MERNGRVEATVTNCGEVTSARLQENLKKVRDERRHEASKLAVPSEFQLAHFHMDTERYGAAVDAHRWANGTAESFEIVGRDSSEDEGADFYDIGTDEDAEEFANECYRCNGDIADGIPGDV